MDKSEINYYDSGSFDHIIKLCKDGGYYIIAGSNGHCKTTMLLNMIKEIASINKEETIALFSLEMSQKKLGNDLKKMDEV
jgi:replicative DNA helicase